MFLIRIDNDLLTERGYLKDDINRLNKKFNKKIYCLNKIKNT